MASASSSNILTPDELNLDDITPDELNLDDITPYELNLDTMTPDGMNRENITLDGVNPEEINLDESKELSKNIAPSLKKADNTNIRSRSSENSEEATQYKGLRLMRQKRSRKNKTVLNADLQSDSPSDIAHKDFEKHFNKMSLEMSIVLRDQSDHTDLHSKRNERASQYEGASNSYVSVSLSKLNTDFSKTVFLMRERPLYQRKKLLEEIEYKLSLQIDSKNEVINQHIVRGNYWKIKHDIYAIYPPDLNIDKFTPNLVLNPDNSDINKLYIECSDAWLKLISKRQYRKKSESLKKQDSKCTAEINSELKVRAHSKRTEVESSECSTEAPLGKNSFLPTSSTGAIPKVRNNDSKKSSKTAELAGNQLYDLSDSGNNDITPSTRPKKSKKKSKKRSKK